MDKAELEETWKQAGKAIAEGHLARLRSEQGANLYREELQQLQLKYVKLGVLTPPGDRWNTKYMIKNSGQYCGEDERKKGYDLCRRAAAAMLAYENGEKNEQA